MRGWRERGADFIFFLSCADRQAQTSTRNALGGDDGDAEHADEVVDGEDDDRPELYLVEDGVLHGRAHHLRARGVGPRDADGLRTGRGHNPVMGYHVGGVGVCVSRHSIGWVTRH